MVKLHERNQNGYDSPEKKDLDDSTKNLPSLTPEPKKRKPLPKHLLEVINEWPSEVLPNEVDLTLKRKGCEHCNELFLTIGPKYPQGII